jgi:hypothetical protein
MEEDGYVRMKKHVASLLYLEGGGLFPGDV